eukprot:TRINITY_DN6085_c0_g1_i2.p1 TRINITY_DN6085_c0_g1~~TRINITY_DN6085_c0_g1_i2.p1  ORF type:complete len:304 (+),score=80.52 TRINITY_DN6085_c0_g1_i2:85-996(+)
MEVYYQLNGGGMEQVEGETEHSLFKLLRKLCFYAGVLGLCCAFFITPATQPARPEPALLFSPSTAAEPTRLWTWGNISGQLRKSEQQAAEKAEQLKKEAEHTNYSKMAQQAAANYSKEAEHTNYSKMAQQATANYSKEAEQFKKKAEHANYSKMARQVVRKAELDKKKVEQTNYTKLAKFLRNASGKVDTALDYVQSVCGVSNYTVSAACWDEMVVAAAIAGGMTVSPVLVRAVGFSETGVEAKSMASLWHRCLGNVEKDSIFARLQSAGAKGELATRNVEIAGVLAARACDFCTLASMLKHG